MAWAKEPVDLAYDDEDLYDRATAEAPDPAPYPYGCRFDLDENDLIDAAGDKGTPGETLKFAAMAEVTSCVHGTDNCRVELQITDLAGEDGKFSEIHRMPEGAEDAETWRRFGCISLCGPELEKMDLEADCDVGDMIHLVGEARLESVSRSDAGAVATLQITALTYAEDESQESRAA